MNEQTRSQRQNCSPLKVLFIFQRCIDYVAIAGRSPVSIHTIVPPLVGL